MIGMLPSHDTEENGTDFLLLHRSQESTPMTTSQTRSFLIEVVEGSPIPVGKLEYFRARLQSRLHQLVLNEWLCQEDQGLTQAELARRIGRKPEVINRLLGAPGNWTVNTVSDLLIGMGAEPEFIVSRLVDRTANATLLISGEARLGEQPEKRKSVEPENPQPLSPHQTNPPTPPPFGLLAPQ